MPKIEIEITGAGELKVDAIGFVGGKCMKATDFLKKLGTVEDVNKKPEFYQQKCEIKENTNLE